MKAPQAIIIVLLSMRFAIHAVKHGEAGEYNVITALTSAVVFAVVLYWGGFFG